MPANKKPIPLLLLTARPNGKDQSNNPIPAIPAFERGAPEAPDWLSDEARAEWNRIVPGLVDLDLLKPEDHAALVQHCETWSSYVAALRKVRREGITIANPETGHRHKNPAVGVMETMGVQLRGTINQFGLSPAAERNIAKPFGNSSDSGDDPYADQTASA